MAESVWKRNFAKNAKIRERVKNQLAPITRQLKLDREEMEMDWERFSKMWNVEKDDSSTYNGRAQLYIPEVRKNVEAQTRQLVEAAFPSEDFFDVMPDGPGGTVPGSEMQKQLRLDQIRRADLRIEYHQFCRQKVLFGNSVAKIQWRKETKRVFRNELVGAGKKRKVRPAGKDQTVFDGPEFKPLSMFRWYALDPKAADWRKAGCVEHDVVSMEDLIRSEKRGELVGIDDIKSGNSDAYKMEELEKDIERMEDRGLQVTNDGTMGVADLNEKDNLMKKGHILKSQIWTSLYLPEAAEPGEDKDLPIPVVIDIYQNEFVGMIKRNWNYDQEAPYVFDTYITPEAGAGLYGQGIPQAIQYMQYEINSKQEQAMDSATLALNPLMFIDPAMAGNKGSFEIEPGGIWWVNPAGIKPAAIPDLTPVGYQAIAQLRSQIQDFSDQAPALAPQLQGKARSATQADIVDRVLFVDRKSFAMQAEIKVLQPLMEKWEMLTDQHLTEDVVIGVLGAHARNWKRLLITQVGLVGVYRYQWKVASNMQNQAVLTRQLLDMLKIFGTLPPEIMGQMRVSFPAMIKMIWKEGFRLPDADKIFGDELKFGQSQDPELEHKMLKKDLEINVEFSDEDEAHLETHKNFAGQKESDKYIEPLQEHMQKHAMQLQFKRDLRQRMQQNRQAAIAAQANGQAEQQKGGSKGSGNRTQLSPAASAGDLGSGTRA